MTTEFDQLRDFLREMFQFEDHDLDFGIYRIIRLKRFFIETSIDGGGGNRLRTTVARELGSVRFDLEMIGGWMENVRQTAIQKTSVRNG